MSTPRNYLTDALYQRLTGKDSLGEKAEAIIGRAEAIIDGYLGTWSPAVDQFQGVAQAASKNGMTLQHEQSIMSGQDLLAGMTVEFISGEAAGEFTTIKSSTALGAVTFDPAFIGTPAAGDVYHIYQMGKIPRRGMSDLTSVLLPNGGGYRYIRNVPAALREAVAAQVLYMVEMGDSYFDGNAMNLDSESFGSYSYTKSAGSKGAMAMVAPKAKQALSGSGLINRTGQIVGY